MLPACFLHASFYTAATYYSIPISTLPLLETHTILPTFLGSTQEAHMGATCVLPSGSSLTGRTVDKLIYSWVDSSLLLSTTTLSSHWYIYITYNKC